MKIKITVGLLLLFNYVSAQNFQFGKISEEKGQKFKSVVGQIGKSIYTCSYKENDLYIHKCSSETMVIEESQKIDTEDSDLRKNSWEVLKVDSKIVFIIGIWDREVPNRILGKTVVEADGKITSGGPLKLISEWKSPEINGKKITMGRDIKMISSSEVDGLPSSNNKILVYYVQFSMISLTNGNKDNMIKAIILDKDLNKLDEQHLDFDKKEEHHLEAPKMDIDGNFYLMSRAFNPTSRETHYYCFIYDLKRKQINKTILVLDKLKENDKPNGFGNFTINSKNNLSFTVLYGPYGRNITGFSVCELNTGGEFSYGIMALEKAMFNKAHTPVDSKTDHFISSISIGMSQNYILLTMSNEGRTKKGESSEEYYSDYAILKKDGSSKFKIVNTYTSEVTNRGGFYNIVNPTLIEGSNKLFMIFAPNKFYCGSFNQKKYFDQICILSTFDFNGGVVSTFLYDVEKTNPLPINDYKLNNGSYIFWGENTQGSVKMDFK